MPEATRKRPNEEGIEEPPVKERRAVSPCSPQGSLQQHRYSGISGFFYFSKVDLLILHFLIFFKQKVDLLIFDFIFIFNFIF